MNQLLANMSIYAASQKAEDKDPDFEYRAKSMAECMRIAKEQLLKEHHERKSDSYYEYEYNSGSGSDSDSDLESDSDSESENEEYDYDAIEDPDERELILSLEGHIDKYKYGAYFIHDVINYTESSIETYRNTKEEDIEPYTTNIYCNNSSNNSINPLKNIFYIWLGVTVINYGAMTIFKKMCR